MPDEEYLCWLPQSARDEEVKPEGVALLEDVVYGSGGGRELLADVVYRQETPPEPRPAIVFIHGGGWSGGNRRQFLRQACYLALRHDYLAVCPAYRYSAEAIFPAAVHDVKCAVRWVRSHAGRYGIDPDRVAAGGGSAGGHLAAMLGVTRGAPELEGDGGWAELSSHVDLAIPLNGAFDLTDAFLGAASEGARDAVRDFLGGMPEDLPERSGKASPMYWVSAEASPMLFLHGAADETVSPQQSVAMYEELTTSGVPSEIELYPGKGHGWFNRSPDFMPVLDRVEAFLVKHFGYGSAP